MGDHLVHQLNRDAHLVGLRRRWLHQRPAEANKETACGIGRSGSNLEDEPDPQPCEQPAWMSLRARVSDFINRRYFDTVPITGRKRYVGLKPRALLRAENRLISAVLKAPADTCLEPDHPDSQLVRRIGERIVQMNGLGQVAEWEFLVVDDPNTESFVTRGGKVFVNTGLLRLVGDSEEEVAAVLGHEIAHELAQHIRDREALTSRFFLWGAAGAGPFYCVFPHGVPVYILGLAVAHKFNKYCVILPASRKFEAEADRIGMVLMARAGYHPRGAVWFFSKLLPRMSETAEYLRIHPLTAKRVQECVAQLLEAQQEMPAQPGATDVRS